MNMIRLNFLVRLQRRPAAVALFASAILLACAVNPHSASAQTLRCYIIADDGGAPCGGGDRLIRINTDNTLSAIGCLVNGGGTIEDVAYNRVDGLLYAGNGANRLGTVNTVTGQWTQLANAIGSGSGSDGTQTFTDIDGLAFRYNYSTNPATATLFAVVRRETNPNPPDLLIQINPSTGQRVNNAFPGGDEYVELVVDGGVGSLDIDDITFATNGTLYAIANTAGGNDRLATINPTTGAATSIGTQFTNTVGGGAVTDFEGLSFGDDGVLYATTGNNSSNSAHRNRVWTVNPANGNVTAILDISSVGSDYEAITCSLRPLGVDLTTFTATSYGKRVLLDWSTGVESATLGFNVYREVDGKRRLLTDRSLVAGSALLTGDVSATARNYAFWDEQNNTKANVLYWLEEIDLRGTRTMHGPIRALKGQGKSPERAQSPPLRAAQGTSTITVSPEPFDEPDGESSDLVSVERGESAQAVQFGLAAQPGVKISVDQAGWHRATRASLIAAGLDPNADPRRFHLYADGVEQSILVSGQADGRFDDGDTVEFYGVPLDSASAGARVYWLAVGANAGNRISAAPTPVKATAGPGVFASTVERKDRIYYVPTIANGEASNFFGPLVNVTSVSQTLPVRHLDLAQPKNAVLQVALQGVTDLPGTFDHQVDVKVNGTSVGTVVFDGQQLFSSQIQVPHQVLHEGDNTISFVSTAGPDDFTLVESVKLTYAHSFLADDDQLDFRAQGGQRLTVAGFTQPKVAVFDITDPARPVLVNAVVQPKNGQFAATFVTPNAGSRRLIALNLARATAPAGLRANTPSTWHSGSGAFAIITHASFAASVEPLRQLRVSQGWSVSVVDVEDLYDEFSFGAKNPDAIKAFLQTTRAQSAGPSHALFVGDASFDPRNFLGLGDFDFLPTKLVQTPDIETASDEWLGDLNGDGVSDVALGRFPVRTPTEAATVVAKIVGYDSAAADVDWVNRALLVADDSDYFDFEAATAAAADRIPAEYQKDVILRGDTDAGTARTNILAGLNEGSLIVNYVGHGSSFLWGAEQLVTSSDAPGLTNGGKLPVYLNMTCYNGLFQDLYTESLAEALLKAPNGGAAGVWASSGLIDPFAQMALDRRIVELLFDGTNRTIGEKIIQAKAEAANSEAQLMVIYFGDPTMRLK